MNILERLNLRSEKNKYHNVTILSQYPLTILFQNLFSEMQHQRNVESFLESVNMRTKIVFY